MLRFQHDPTRPDTVTLATLLLLTLVGAILLLVLLLWPAHRGPLVPPPFSHPPQQP